MSVITLDQYDYEPRILVLTAGGIPYKWETLTKAVNWYSGGDVLWEAGESVIRLRGGYRDSQQSHMDINSIIAVNNPSKGGLFDHGLVPRLTNEALFERDRNICQYCGRKFSSKVLTRDHVHPRSRGGQDKWTNVVTSCFDDNNFKGNRTPEEAGMELLSIPYEPSIAEILILKNRRILFDQMVFLEGLAEKLKKE